MIELPDYKNDTTPSRVLAERQRTAADPEDYHLGPVHHRGGQVEFQLGCEYATSSDPHDRRVGAEILGSLGVGKQTFLNQSVALLIAMLQDPCEDVIQAAAIALNRRHATCAIPPLVSLADHPSELVRYGVVHGLMGYEDDRAITTMIRLAHDPDHDTRNWAVFGLGSQIEIDSPEIRQALRDNLHDPDHEIRGEALVGLAERRDPETCQLIMDEWDTYDTLSVLSLQVAELIADKRLIPDLEEFVEDISPDDHPYLTGTLKSALKASQTQQPPYPPMIDTTQ